MLLKKLFRSRNENVELLLVLQGVHVRTKLCAIMAVYICHVHASVGFSFLVHECVLACTKADGSIGESLISRSMLFSAYELITQIDKHELDSIAFATKTDPRTSLHENEQKLRHSFRSACSYGRANQYRFRIATIAAAFQDLLMVFDVCFCVCVLLFRTAVGAAIEASASEQLNQFRGDSPSGFVCALAHDLGVRSFWLKLI